MTRTVSALCLAFLFVLPLQSKTLAQDITPPKIEALPPAGFETLGEPQPYFVDVVFGDEVVGQANVVARPGEVTLQSPGAVMELLPAIRAEVRGQVLQALTGALAANAGLSCEPRPREGCGLLEPAIAGVIFDDAVLRLTVFINPQFLDVDPSATAQRDLPPSSADGPAFYNPLSVFYAGTFNEETTHDLNAFSDSYLTWGEASIHVASSYFSQPLTTPEGEGGNFSLDDATFLYVRPGWLYQAGLADTAAIDLIGTGRFLGAGVETTTATRLDLESAQGSSLVVFLPSRSTVELVVEGRTLSRRQYPAGNVALDTDGLPDGAYNLTIRIRDDAGNLTEETRFYARSTDVPLRDAPNYVLQAGVLVEDERSALPIVTDTPVVRAGAAYRLADDLALGADLLATPDIVIGSGTFDFFSTLGVFTGSVLATSEGDYGASATFYGTLDLFSYAFSGQLLERAQEPVDGGGGTANDLLGASYRQASLTLSYPINDNLDLSFQGYWRDDATTKMSYGFGPTLNWRIYNGPDLSITMNVAATHTDVETLGQLQFQISYNTGEQSRWSVNSTLGTLGAFDRADTSSYDRTYNPYAYAQAQWSDDELLVDDVRVYGGVAHDTQRTTSAFIGGGHKSQWADLSGEARRSYIEDGDVTTVMQAGLTTALSLDSNGIALGGAEIADAAIVIDLSSGDESVVYDVLVNGQKRVSLQGSTTAVLPLQPYHTYRVLLLPRGGASVQGELQQKTVTLYPGNSVTLSWETYRVLAIFGRVLDENGTAIGQARIDGDIGIAFSDEAGFFQIEVKDDTPLTLTKGGTSCRIDLAGSGVGLKQEVEYLNVSDLVCR